MDLRKCDKCGSLLKRITISRKGRWYCNVCREVK